MLGVEVFRDKQGQGQGRRDAEKEGKEGGVEEEIEEKEEESQGAAENEGELDLKNGGQDGSSEPKTNGGNQATSS